MRDDMGDHHGSLAPDISAPQESSGKSDAEIRVSKNSKRGLRGARARQGSDRKHRQAQTQHLYQHIAAQKSVATTLVNQEFYHARRATRQKYPQADAIRVQQAFPHQQNPSSLQMAYANASHIHYKPQRANH